MTHLLQYNHVTGTHDEVDIPGGGGSELFTLEVTAEQIGDSWDEENGVAAISLDQISPGDLLQVIWEEDNSLDQGQQLNTVVMYLPDASSADVTNLGSPFSDVVGGTPFPATYGHVVQHSDKYAVANAGSQVYAIYSGDDSPTEGTSTLKILVAKA